MRFDFVKRFQFFKESMAKMTKRNETNAEVFRSVLASLPATHPYLNELRQVDGE